MDDFSALEEATMRIDELEFELSEAEIRLQRIRDLHTSKGPGGFDLGLCLHCSYRAYPCPTILALEEMANDDYSGETS